MRKRQLRVSQDEDGVLVGRHHNHEETGHGSVTRRNDVGAGAQYLRGHSSRVVVDLAIGAQQRPRARFARGFQGHAHANEAANWLVDWMDPHDPD